MAHPNDSYKKASAFERSVRYNYSQQDLDNLLEILFIIDNLSNAYYSYGSQIEKYIKKAYNSEFKSFIENKLEAARQCLVKKNKFTLG